MTDDKPIVNCHSCGADGAIVPSVPGYYLCAECLPDYADDFPDGARIPGA